MEIKLTIKEIDYAALVEAALPMVKNKLQDMDGPIPSLLSGLTKLPTGMVKAVVNGLPQDSKDQMAVLLIKAYREKIISSAERYAGEMGVPIKIDEFHVER